MGASSADYAATSTALLVSDEGMTKERWAAVLKEVGPERATSWHVGDLLAFGERRFGDGSYRLAAEALGYSNLGSLRNLASVSRNVDPEVRQPDISWRAHRVVAKLEKVAQRDWLSKAAQCKWTSDELARAIRAAGESEKDADDWTDPEGGEKACSRCNGSGIEP
jgi:hypothetical protein